MWNIDVTLIHTSLKLSSCYVLYGSEKPQRRTLSHVTRIITDTYDFFDVLLFFSIMDVPAFHRYIYALWNYQFWQMFNMSMNDAKINFKASYFLNTYGYNLTISRILKPLCSALLASLPFFYCSSHSLHCHWPCLKMRPQNIHYML